VPHVVLLGDSIFDNSAYTGGEPDVVAHLRTLLPAAWTATLLAVDGATTAGIASQLARVPQEATHVVVSIGGNDALGQSDLLRTPVKSTAEALALFATRAAAFDRQYRAALSGVLALRRDTTLCTVYNGNLDRDVADIARIGLTVFNDVILQFAFEHRLKVLELRQICNRPSDYANPIEPSGTGGKKIAAAIARAIGALEPHAPHARVSVD
jgi:lysophospholipase L1-like esterase